MQIIYPEHFPHNLETLFLYLSRCLPLRSRYMNIVSDFAFSKMVEDNSTKRVGGPDLLFTIFLQFVDFYFLLHFMGRRIIEPMGPLLRLVRTPMLFEHFKERFFHMTLMIYVELGFPFFRFFFWQSQKLQFVSARDPLVFGDISVVCCRPGYLSVSGHMPPKKTSNVHYGLFF